MKYPLILAGLVSGVLAGCGPKQAPPEAFGLVGGRAFPGPNDVCRVIGSNNLTQKYQDENATLIGCPSAETGAIADRVASGAVQVDQVGEYVLLYLPN